MLLPLIAAGVAVYLLATHKKKPEQAVTLTGKSGTPYAVATTRSGIDPVTHLATVVKGVFLLPNGTPVMEYSQSGASAPRFFLSSPLQPNDPILIRAKADFIS